MGSPGPEARLDPELTYLVESAEDRHALLALWPRLDPDHVSWFDTSHDRGAKVHATRVEGDAVVVETPRAVYRFRVLTAALYDERVRARVQGAPRLSSDEAVQAFYRDFPG
jgi:hypothetical protein